MILLFNGNHNGQAYPLDKPLPKLFTKEDAGSEARKIEKKRHKRRQREYNKKLIKEEE